MKHILPLIFLCSLNCITAAAQQLSRQDSLKVLRAVDALFQAIEKSDRAAFGRIAADSIRCAVCELPEQHQALCKEQFFNQQLKIIRAQTAWKRATKRNKQLMVVENQPYSDVSVFFQIYAPGEIAAGHEGAQLGLWFKKQKQDYQFTGIETIP